MDGHDDNAPWGPVGPDAPDTDEALERAYTERKARYYRHVLRKEDGALLRRILKIPDSWSDYERAHGAGASLSDHQKKRLSDIKKSKGDELAFESRYILGLITIENALLACLQYHESCAALADDALESAREILAGAAAGPFNFKHLLLSLAKRSISDLYYLMASYQKFYHKKCFEFDADFTAVVERIAGTIRAAGTLDERLRGFSKYREIIAPFFTRSSTYAGLRLDEISLKRQYESGGIGIKPEHLEIVVPALDAYRTELRRNHDFIAYYYNRTDGKRYRYDFIRTALLQKNAAGGISEETLESFIAVHDSFCAIEARFLEKGLADFGPPALPYGAATELAFQCCKVLEYLYLRGGHYEKLQDMRSRWLQHTEQDLHRLRQLA
ncbi:MAG TPA: hypothetical protein PLE73_13805 [Spirochaetota bacterium]|nr:hypothetical protein [Spirochaetota bacterium]HPI24270.1 hypothetical protein [Spirochaetota bacterium]